MHKTKRVLSGLVVMGVLVSVIVPAGAAQVGDPMDPLSLTGSRTYSNYTGQNEFYTCLWRAGAPAMGQLGAEWAGPVELWSLTVTQLPAGRDQLKTLWLYTSPTTYYVIPFDATEAGQQGEQVIDLAALNGGKPVLAERSYVTLVVKDSYPGGDGNMGVVSYGFDARWIGPADVNVNHSETGTVMSQTGGYDINSAVPIYAVPSRTNDGLIAAGGGSQGTFWRMSEDEPASLTATYLTPQTVGSIGLAFAGDEKTRNCPKWVTVSDGLGNSEIVYIDETLTQYGRYELSGPFVDILSLTVTMPPTDGDNWWINDGGTTFGITEFQAFAAIPEPVTMSLLALGGLAMLRRRR